MSAVFNLGIQSYCFRKFLPISELVDALEQAGLSYVEIWPRHLHWTLDSAAKEGALSVLRSKGMTVSAYGAVEFGNDEAQARPVFAFVREAGIGALTVTKVEPDAFSLVEGLAEEYGITLEECLYIGDDLNDLTAIQAAGVGVVPGNASGAVKKYADFVTTAQGGQGAVREAADTVLAAQGYDAVELWFKDKDKPVGMQ